MLKILFADDEPWVLEGLTIMVDWEELGIEPVGKASDGQTALEMINSIHPDIVISDIHMPGLSGLELLKICSEKRFRPEFIMLTGYGELEYVRASMKYGAVRFIMKPIDPVEITEALRDVSSHIYESREAAEAQEEALDAVRQETFQRVLFGEKNDKLYKRAGFLLGAEPDIAVNVVIMRANNGIGEDEMNAFGSRIRHLIRETGMAGFRVGDKTYVVLDIEDPELSCGGIAEIATDFFTGVYTASADGFAELTDIYREAIRHFSIPAENVQTIKPGTGGGKKIKGNPSDVLSLAMNGKEKEAFERLDGDLSSDIPTDAASSYASALLICMCRSANRTGINMESLFDDALNAINNAYDVNTVRMLCRECLETFIRLSEKISGWSQAAVSEEAVNFILEHYDENLTLTSISKSLHINSGIISRAIKTGTGMKFNNYLNYVRIQNAKRLILNTNTKITNIAAEVGYNDYYYFTNKFKALTGELPSDYRRNRRDKKEEK